MSRHIDHKAFPRNRGPADKAKKVIITAAEVRAFAKTPHRKQLTMNKRKKLVARLRENKGIVGYATLVVR